VTNICKQYFASTGSFKVPAKRDASTEILVYEPAEASEKAERESIMESVTALEDWLAGRHSKSY
jgi:hypothetical protein